MLVAILDNNAVTNIVEAESLDIFPDMNVVDVTNEEDVTIGSVYQNGVFTNPLFEALDAAILTKTKSADMRAERDALLAETDVWVLPDRTPTQEQLDYRQALRDLPAQEGFPDVEFPTKP
jgi:hypothetical protein